MTTSQLRRGLGVRLPILAAAALLAGGCASGQPAAPASPPVTRSATAPSATAESTTDDGAADAEGALAAPQGASNAFTYNPALAPEGAQIEADVDHRAGVTEVQLDVDSLLPTPPTPTRRTRSGSTCAPTATGPARRERRCRSRSPTGPPRRS